MSEKVKVTAIIPCFNEENTIEKIVNKVLEETLNFSYLNFEIIVINGIFQQYKYNI